MRAELKRKNPMTLDTDTLYIVANSVALGFWLMLIFAPRWQGTQALVHSLAPAILFGGVYTWLFASGVFFGDQVPPEAGFGTLKGLMILFTQPEAVLAGWVHYLVFDLFVGAWIVRDSHRRKLPHLAVIPCLALTLLAGPIGLLLYLLGRAIAGRGSWSLAETTAST